MKKIISLIILFILTSGDLIAKEWVIPIGKNESQEFCLAIDPYYSYAEYIFSLTNNPIPKTEFSTELNVYFTMLKNYYKPRYLLFEISVYPLPTTGVFLKKHANDFYKSAQFTQNFNLIKSITAGFPEPWATSVFLGNIIDFTETNSTEIVGKGYSGFLFSYGNYYIVDNILINDHWFELETKIKGTNIKREHNLSWSYAIGSRLHMNNDIRDTLYLSIKRSRIDYANFSGNLLLFLIFGNSEQEFRIDFDLMEFYQGRLTSLMFLFGKKFPFFQGRVTPSVSVGAIKNFSSGYNGALESKVNTNWGLIIRPNVTIQF